MLCITIPTYITSEMFGLMSRIASVVLSKCLLKSVCSSFEATKKVLVEVPQGGRMLWPMPGQEKSPDDRLASQA